MLGISVAHITTLKVGPTWMTVYIKGLYYFWFSYLKKDGFQNQKGAYTSAQKSPQILQKCENHWSGGIRACKLALKVETYK